MKPSDFFLGVVNFLGVLVPGAILLALLDRTFAMPKDFPVPGWLVFGGASYVVGQLLLAATEILNGTVRTLGRAFGPKVRNDVVVFRKQARRRLDLLSAGSRQAKFHTALSYLKMKNSTAAAEVEHHMADYKLLRNLLAVLVIDLSVRAVKGQTKTLILVVEGLSIVACLVAFVRMFNWAQLLSFQYVCLIADSAKATKTETQE